MTVNWLAWYREATAWTRGLHDLSKFIAARIPLQILLPIGLASLEKFSSHYRVTWITEAVRQQRRLSEMCLKLDANSGRTLSYLFTDLYKEIVIRSPKKVGYSGLR